MEKAGQEQKKANRRVHLANERTFLAWIRTSISVMAFGFVMERFSLFVRQISAYLGKEASVPSPGYSSIFGIILIGLGTIMGVLAFLRYRSVERQIETDSYAPSPFLNTMVTLAVLAIGIFLVFYLIHRI
jgi:uncharacterized membrane protein YidH (DUF202 family)